MQSHWCVTHEKYFAQESKLNRLLSNRPKSSNTLDDQASKIVQERPQTNYPPFIWFWCDCQTSDIAKKTWRKSLPFRASNGVNSNPMSATIFLYYIFEIKMLIFAVKSNENGHFMPFISIFHLSLPTPYAMTIGVFRDKSHIIRFVIYSRIWWASFFRPICPFIAHKYE